MFEAGAAGGNRWCEYTTLYIMISRLQPVREGAAGGEIRTRQLAANRLTLPGRHLLPRTCDTAVTTVSTLSPASTNASQERVHET